MHRRGPSLQFGLPNISNVCKHDHSAVDCSVLTSTTFRNNIRHCLTHPDAESTLYTELKDDNKALQSRWDSMVETTKPVRPLFAVPLQVGAALGGPQVGAALGGPQVGAALGGPQVCADLGGPQVGASLGAALGVHHRKPNVLAYLSTVNVNKIDSKTFGSVRNNKGECNALVDTMVEMGREQHEDVRCPLLHPQRPHGMSWRCHY
jgi:hypothetical protein